MLINYEGLAIKLEKKRIKNINLRIRRTGELYLSAPPKVPLQQIYQFLQAKLLWIQKHLSTLEVEQPPKAHNSYQEQYQKMQEILPALFKKWENIIQVKASKVSIKLMKSRWGSCNTVTKQITINLRLIEKPTIYLEYVIVHELVHLLEPSHNKRFYALMSKYMPEWKGLRNELRG